MVNSNMKSKITIQIVAVILLSLLSFWLGRLSYSRNVITYSIDGIPTSFNRAWPTYGLPLANYEPILVMLQNGHSTNAIPYMETFLDSAIYEAKCRRSLLRDKDLKALDMALVRVAQYRQRFPRPITESTNGLDRSWIARQKEVDVFLGSFVNTNAVKTQLP